MTCFKPHPRVSISLTLLFLMTLANAPAHAHGIHVDTSTAPAVTVSFSYEDGSPVAFETCEVLAPGDPSPFQNGNTDRLGRVTFRPDQAGTWKVRVWSADGHGNTAEVVVTDDLVSATTKRDHLAPRQRIITGVAVLFGVFGIVTLVLRRRSP